MSKDAPQPPLSTPPLPPLPELRALDLLCRIVRCGSVGAAARDLGMSQPQASRLLHRLERDLGVELVRRSPTGSTPTTSGQLVVDWASPIMAGTERLLTGVASLRADAESGHSIAASLTIGEHLAPLWLAVYTRRHPDRQVRLRVTNSATVIADLHRGAVDLGFIETVRRPAGLRTTVVATDDLVVVTAPTHPWARRRHPLTLAELADTALVVRELGSGTRDTLDRALSPYPRRPPAMELSSSEAIRTAVAAGSAPAVLSRVAVADAVRAGTLVVISVAGPALRRQLRAVWRPPGRPVGWVGEFVRIARQSSAADPGGTTPLKSHAGLRAAP
ncbi:LysR family transcriptional regulator [Austwickia sp. TVS 96-490-7B]|uniref:LysR family transcriptional regulator n=1 Tax=Austwickia sp. TVS 96-490-7B TaxID=2830843 RepID=UPI001C57BD76|nr:LysR family transcriptional regulator [Austwickia sp. TVS 96-490-7B]